MQIVIKMMTMSLSVKNYSKHQEIFQNKAVMLSPHDHLCLSIVQY